MSIAGSGFLGVSLYLEQQKSCNTQIRLDKTYVNALWLEQFPVIMVHHMEMSRSDHAAFMIK